MNSELDYIQHKHNVLSLFLSYFSQVSEVSKHKSWSCMHIVLLKIIWFDT